MSTIREGTSAVGNPASVTLVEDETLFRDLLRGALEQTGQVSVVNDAVLPKSEFVGKEWYV